MYSLHKQRGISFTGLLFIIIFVGLIATMAMRLVPVYLENRGVIRAVNNVMNQPDFNGGNMRKADFYKRIEQNFYTNDVKSFPREEHEKMVKIVKNKESGEKEMLIQYEHEVPFMKNIFFRVKFEEVLPIKAGGTGG